MKRTLKEIKDRVKQLIEKDYNVIRWLDDEHCIVFFEGLGSYVCHVDSLLGVK